MLVAISNGRSQKHVKQRSFNRSWLPTLKILIQSSTLPTEANADLSRFRSSDVMLEARILQEQFAEHSTPGTHLAQKTNASLTNLPYYSPIMEHLKTPKRENQCRFAHCIGLQKILPVGYHEADKHYTIAQSLQLPN